MPKAKEATEKATPISRGAGMTAGLELALVGSTFVLVDQSPDHRFAADVEIWTATRPKPSSRKQRKDATPAQ